MDHHVWRGDCAWVLVRLPINLKYLYALAAALAVGALTTFVLSGPRTLVSLLTASAVVLVVWAASEGRRKA
jgi:hypothetical protein